MSLQKSPRLKLMRRGVFKTADRRAQALDPSLFQPCSSANASASKSLGAKQSSKMPKDCATCWTDFTTKTTNSPPMATNLRTEDTSQAAPLWTTLVASRINQLRNQTACWVTIIKSMTSSSKNVQSFAEKDTSSTWATNIKRNAGAEMKQSRMINTVLLKVV